MAQGSVRHRKASWSVKVDDSGGRIGTIGNLPTGQSPKRSREFGERWPRLEFRGWTSRLEIELGSDQAEWAERERRDAEAGVKRRLSVMFALVSSVQGAFWPLFSIHLVDLSGSERGRGWMFATIAVASFAMSLGEGTTGRPPDADPGRPLAQLRREHNLARTHGLGGVGAPGMAFRVVPGLLARHGPRATPCRFGPVFLVPCRST